MSVASRETPYQRHSRAMLAAKLAWDATVDSPATLRSLPQGELAAWASCRTTVAPVTALPFSLALGFLAFSAASSFALRAPQLALAQAVGRRRAVVGAAAGGVHFALGCRRHSSFCEPCYMHAMAGDNEAAAAMRDAYRAIYPDSAFLAVAEGVAARIGGRQSPGGPGAAATAAAGGSGGAFSLAEGESRVRALSRVSELSGAF
jgi:hypothetical protein